MTKKKLEMKQRVISEYCDILGYTIVWHSFNVSDTNIACTICRKHCHRYGYEVNAYELSTAPFIDIAEDLIEKSKKKHIRKFDMKKLDRSVILKNLTMEGRRL